MRNRDYTATADFLKGFFAETLHKVELRACPNVKGLAGAKSVMTDTDLQRVSFCIEKDVDGIGVYFGVCTRQEGATSGNLDTVAECPALWVDIDCAKQGISGDDALAALNFLPHPPSLIVNSGGGLHAYWLLEQPVDVSPGQHTREVVTACLRQLAMVLAGDLQCAELARILRLPGTMNSKSATKLLYDGQPALCEVIENSGRVHDFDTLRLWLGTQRAVLHGRIEAPRPVVETDPFVRYAREVGYEPAIDVEAELAGIVPGHHRNGIHPTQLRVSMSLLARGYDDDEIVEMLLKATAHHAPANDRWDWSAEEKALRNMISSGRKKVEERQKSAPQRVIPSTSGNAALKLVHDADADDEEEPSPKGTVKESKSATVAVGKAAIGVWKERYGPVMHTQGTTYCYEGGIWEVWNDTLHQRLRAIIQEACAALGLEPKTALLNAAKAYFMDRPELTHNEVTFDAHGLLIAEDGCLDLNTLEIIDHSPKHYALFKVSANVRGSRECPAWLDFLQGAFADRGCSAEIISTIQEWYGVSIAVTRSRPLLKGMLVHGPSRSGKTQVSKVLRGLLGPKHICNALMRDLEGRFGKEPLIGKRGWIADDAIGPKEYLDAETYKVVVTGEDTSAQMKGGKNWEGRFGFPVMLTANNLPRVNDKSDATYNRSLILPMTVVRPETAPEPEGYESLADKVIAEELTGVLWWAVEGRRRVMARGRFDPPAPMTDAKRSFQDSNDPIGTWIRECVELSDDTKVARKDLAASFNGWWALESEDGKDFSSNSITREILSRFPTIDECKSHGERMFGGIRLNEEGLFAWDHRVGSAAGFDKKVGFSLVKEEVNRYYDMRPAYRNVINSSSDEEKVPPVSAPPTGRDLAKTRF
ncbi:phage/plasmid primase, P4 family [Rhizorhabdus histidinilytica]|uniref:Phage/plasmid primase, P4 family, C-terminal domain-containing protein n=2 Tax=Rhizorhabdus histidinilytica TaxID=439228 RepID=A0A1T5A8M9_9SPHN|nr:phage/plasmid primase, P4 family, C-terminal domain-containing protein [Rhizorhabdus histidinilytica]